MNDRSNTRAVKEASGSLEQMKSVIACRHDGFTVLSGDDNMTVDLIEAGGDGVISVASNLIPDRMVRLVHTALDGSIDEARRLEEELMPFFRACFLETNPIPIKTAMAACGWCEETFRLPMCPFTSESDRHALLEVLKELQIS